VTQEELMEMKKKKPEQTIKLTAASLRELRLLYNAGAINRSYIASYLDKSLGLTPEQAAPEELPMPKEQAQEFLQDLKQTMEARLGSKT
jgi:hypothetical protein